MIFLHRPTKRSGMQLAVKTRPPPVDRRVV
jgi:hypothetical protein